MTDRKAGQSAYQEADRQQPETQPTDHRPTTDINDQAAREKSPCGQGQVQRARLAPNLSVELDPPEDAEFSLPNPESRFVDLAQRRQDFRGSLGSHQLLNPSAIGGGGASHEAP